jgi:threonine/homoserine/homoserine lactone efflux protein
MEAMTPSTTGRVDIMVHFFVILGIIWLAVISPGADFAMVSRASFTGGRGAGFRTAAGIALGCWVHIGYALFGLEMIARFVPNLLDIIRLVGAAYLVWIGAAMMLARPSAAAGAMPATGTGRALAGGFLTNALNPKTSMFVVSLYAQGIGGGSSLAIRLGYGAAISLSHLLWFMMVAAFLARPAIRSRVLRRQRAVNAAIGVLLIGLGAALAFYDVAAVGTA